MDVYWFEQSEADIPREDDWLAAAEKDRCSALRVPKRRADWRLGRWTAKRAIALRLKMPGDLRALASIEIRPASSGAPEVFIASQAAPTRISISHCDGNALCAIASVDAPIGCDLEHVEARSDAFLSDYFTGEEQARVAQAAVGDRTALVTLLWSAKESTLKALCEGLRLDTRSVIISFPEPIGRGHQAEGTRLVNSDGAALVSDSASWRPLEVRCRESESLQGWWRLSDGFVRTLVAPQAVNPPIALRIGPE